MGTVPLQTGFLLLPVAFMLAVIALAAFWLNQQGALNVDMLAGETETAEAQFAAEAGLNHAIWQANQANCENYQNVPDTQFGYDRYQADVTPTSGSPITIAATGTSARGAVRTLTRTPVQVYEPTTGVLSLKPDATDGKDTTLFQPQSGKNYGAFPSLSANLGVEHALLEFPVTSIPSSALIITAKLRLFAMAVNQAGEVGAYGVTTPWNEGTGSGDPCFSGTTWWYTNCWADWPTYGGDADPEPSGKQSVTAMGAWVEFDLTDLTQAWVSGQRPNYGVLLKPTGAADVSFRSSDAGSLDEHPEFIVTYFCECGSGGGSFSETLKPGSTGEDTYIDDGSPSTNFGDQNEIRLSNKTNNKQRGLLRFDLGSIPLQLNLKGIGSGGVASVDVHRATTSWAELQANWNNATSSTPWTSPGGDWDTMVEDTAVIDAAVPGPTTWDVTNLVAAWLDGTYDNDGIVLLGSADVNHADFTTSDDSDPSARPQLTIDYLVVPDAAILSAQDTVKKTLIESWNFAVTLISATATQDDFNAAVATSDVAYVSEEITSSDLGTKLRSAAIGVVIEEQAITDEFGMASGNTTFMQDSVDVIDNSHFITSPFSLGVVAFTDSLQDVGGLSGTPAPGLGVLAQLPSSSTGTLTFIETGGALFDTGTAAGRRVKLPWGGNDFDINTLTTDGQIIMERAIRWGAGAAGAELPTLIAHWKLDDGSGMTAVDSAGNNDGNLVGPPAWATGTIDGGLDFNGVNDYVDAGTFDVSGSGLTLMGWFNADALPAATDPRIISKASSAAEADAWWQLSILTSASDRNIRLRTKAGGTTSTLIDSSTNLNPGEWYFAVGTYDSGTGDMKLYLNGVEVASQSHTVGGAVDTDATVPVAIGANGSTEQFFDGVLDDVRVYDYALTATAISDLFAAGGGGGGSGPVFESFEEFIDADDNTAAVSVAKPVETVADDLLVAVVVTNRNNAATLVADDPGWTLLTRDAQANAHTVGVWWRLAGGAEPASYGFSWDSANPGRSYSWIMRFSGNDPTNPINVWDKIGEANVTSPLSPAVTTTVNDTLILRLGGFDDDDITIGDPGMAGHTAINMQKSSTGTGTVSGGAAYISQAASGDSGTANFTLTAAEQSRTITIGIAPAP
jgi:hypothetical protein